jgi:acetyl esterase/lipase
MTNDSVIRTLRAGVAALGAKFNEEVLAATRSLYAPHVRLDEGVRESLDVPYGEHARHRMDLFQGQGTGRPVVLFVHGGGYVAGDKRPGQPFYANLGRFFAARGYLAVTMNYRLAAAHPWPAGRDDVAAAVEWLAGHTSEHGGDPRRIVLLGQSAGASHVASYLFDPATSDAAVQRVHAAALMSGGYTVHTPAPAPQQAYFGSDASTYEARSPSTHVARNPVPLLLCLAEYDPTPFARQTLGMADALSRARGACPPLQWLAGHNHVSTVMSLGTPQAEVGDRLLEFFGSALDGK